MMLKKALGVVLALMVLSVLVGCAQLPRQQVDAAHAKIEEARNSHTLTPTLEKMGQNLDEELALQQRHFFQDYKLTAELCTKIDAYQIPPRGSQPLAESQPHPVPTSQLRYCPCCGRAL